MSAQITLNLPEEIMERANQWAKFTGQAVDDLLAEAIELSLAPLEGDVAASLENWSDEKVLAATNTQMSPAEDRRISELLGCQQGGVLTEQERMELRSLMTVYQGGLLRKARALREAIRRGLREPIQP